MRVTVKKPMKHLIFFNKKLYDLHSKNVFVIYSVMLLLTLLQFTLGQKGLIFSVDTEMELARR